MTMYWSPSKAGFYHPDIHGVRGKRGSSTPKDSVELTDEEYRALLTGNHAGKQIVLGPEGRPILQDPPPPRVEPSLGHPNDLFVMLAAEMPDGPFKQRVVAWHEAHERWTRGEG